MKLYIEDLICRLANEGPYMFTQPLQIWSMDASVITSLGQNPTLGKGFTEKQRNLVLRLCKKYRSQLFTQFGKDSEDALDNPEFKFPLIEPASQEKTIAIVDKEILVKFPFSEEIVAKIRKFRDTCLVKLVDWASEDKAWKFKLEENNVMWIAGNLDLSTYSVDPKFTRIFEEISEILGKIEDHVPTIVKTDTGFSFLNVPDSVPQPSNDSLIETVLLAKHYGITTWDENVSNLLKTVQLSPILAEFLNETNPNSLEFDVNENSIDQFTDLFKYNVPALIIVPGYNEFFTLKNWLQWLKNQNFEEKDISVMFRLANDTGSMFNDLVKQNNINNPIGENTKIVFISQKLPKPLIKSGIDFKLIINLGSLSGVHYSVSSYLDNRPDVIRYTDKNKSGYQFGLL
jgi:hypothetical protein